MNKSDILFIKAKKFISGGVNSPVRAFNSVGGTPIFFKSGKDAFLFDEDNNKYIDYVASWGAMILGHANTDVVDAVSESLKNGLSFGAPTEVETLLAQKICEIMPSIELVRMVSSGTEATMSAIRLARGYTKRDKIIKFNGCYHGHSDSLLVKAGSGALTLNIPTSLGVPIEFIKNTIVLKYNNIKQVREVLSKIGYLVACIIVEPVAGNMNCVLPVKGFLQELRDVCDEYNIVLIFDEVISGFRVALGGAQQYYNIKPDLTTLGKIIGGGLPAAAFGGKREIMRFIAPLGPVYQAGTLSGNPLAMIAGLTTLNILTKDNNFYKKLEYKTKKLVNGILLTAKAHNINLTVNTVGAMFGIFFSKEKQVTNFEQVLACDSGRFKIFYNLLLSYGVYMAPSPYESSFITSAHTDKDIADTIVAFDKAFTKL